VDCLYESACYLCYVQDSLPKIRRNAAISSSLLPHSIHARKIILSDYYQEKNLSLVSSDSSIQPAHINGYSFVVVYLSPSSTHIL